MMKYGLALMVMMLAFNSNAANKADSERGWYAGIAAGTATFNDAANSPTLDDSDTSFSLFGGFRFNRYLAVQGNVVDLGEYADSGSILVSTELSGVVASAVGLLPVKNTGVEFFGRAGITILNYTQNFENSGFILENSSTGDALAVSLGVNYSLPFFKRLTLHVAYDYYYFETKKTFDSADEGASNSIGVLGTGLRFNF